MILIQVYTAAFSGGGPSVEKIISDYRSLRTIRATLKQQVYLPGGGMEFYSGDYYADSNGRLRIDYTYPEKSTVINCSEGLFWYYPDRKMVYVKKSGRDGAAYSGLAAIRLVDENPADISVTYEGMEFYSFFKRAAVYSITSLRSSTVIKIWTDPDGLYVLRKYVLDSSGREIIREIWSDHVYVSGVYIPSRIELYVRTAGGIVHTVTAYSNISVNASMSDELFRHNGGKGFKVRELDDM